MEQDPRFKGLPSVGRIMDDPALASSIARFGRPLATAIVREILDTARSRLEAGKTPGARLTSAAIAAEVEERATRLLGPAPRVVINATGVVAHTNLGRSVLSAAAAGRVAEVARGYVDLEYDLARGARGDRMSHLEPLLRRLFPGHASLAVVNNAAAIFLALRALARGKEVVVSRGELVEIGGAFRVPDILRASGAAMHEVGTTNRTRIADYEAAVGP
ncbi:MAG TPA: hypothetical protein VFB67_12475, partial [Candidatus Polarisedimenticolaceae bacterium]|nr:hypothetical protein [Candidatus Polarisedimenticolaceae bacterium]